MNHAEKFKKWILLGLPIILLLIYLYSRGLSDAFSVLVYSVFISLILTPLCRRLERAGLSTAVSSALSIIFVISVLLLFVFLLFPYLARHAVELLSRCLPALQALMLSAEKQFSAMGLSGINMVSMLDGLVSAAAKLAGTFARGGLSIAAETGKVVFSLVIAYYVLKERELVGYYVLMLVPSVFRETALFSIKACKNAVMGYLGGLLKTCVFVGASTSICLMLLGIGDAVLLGVLMGLLEVIPYIGPVLGSIPVLLSAIPLGIHKTILSLSFLILIQQAESSFIGPYFTSSSTSVHPLAALLSVYILGSIFGIWGVALAVPVVVACRSAVWSFSQFRRIQKAQESIET